MTDLLLYNKSSKFKIVHVAVLHNPFNISERQLFMVEINEDMSLERFLSEHVKIDENKEYHASINGKVYTPDELCYQILNDGDHVAVCPVLKGGGGGKNPLAILAGLALAFFAFGVVGPAVTNMFGGAGIAGAAMAGKIAAGLTLMVGGQLISNAFMPKMEQESDEQSYGWGALQPIQAQGAVIPITYGTIRTAGQVLAQHVDIVEDVQYLSVLLCGGEGPIDSFSDILVNDNPIANFQDVEFHTRAGVNTQALIEKFNDLYSDQYFNYVLNTQKKADGTYNPSMPGEWVTQKVSSDAAEGLIIDISFPSGLYRVDKEDGSSHSTFVNIDVEYAIEINGTIQAWQKWDIGTDGLIDRKKKKPFVMSYRKDHLSPAQYHVRMRARRKDFDDPQEGANMASWTKISTIVYQPMIHPGKALLGVRMRASDQLSGGAPTITWRQTRSKVLVFENSSWVKKDAQNPAWIVYDLCVKARDVDGTVVVFGIDPSRMDLPQF